MRAAREDSQFVLGESARDASADGAEDLRLQVGAPADEVDKFALYGVERTLPLMVKSRPLSRPLSGEGERDRVRPAGRRCRCRPSETVATSMVSHSPFIAARPESPGTTPKCAPISFPPAEQNRAELLRAVRKWRTS